MPKMQMSTVTGGPTVTRNEPSYSHLMNASAWAHGSASLIREQTAVPATGLFDGMSLRPEKLEGIIDVQEGHCKPSRNITEALINSVGGDKEILDEISNQKHFEEHPEADKKTRKLVEE
jgi:hypothetical protein